MKIRTHSDVFDFGKNKKSACAYLSYFFLVCFIAPRRDGSSEVSRILLFCSREV